MGMDADVGEARSVKAGPSNGLGGQPLAALGATATDDLAAVLGGHPRAETVTARTHQTAGLESPLHGEGSGSKDDRPGEREVRPPVSGGG
jgi:hypothetical protein